MASGNSHVLATQGLDGIKRDRVERVKKASFAASVTLHGQLNKLLNTLS